MIKTWREAYEVPNSAEEAKRYDEEPVSGPASIRYSYRGG